MARIVADRFMLGEVLGHRLKFSEKEASVLRAAALIAEKARSLNVDEDSDTLLAEIEHGCRDLLEDPKGLSVYMPELETQGG